MSRKLSIDKDTQKKLDVRRVYRVSQSQQLPPDPYLVLPTRQEYRASATTTAEEVVFKIFPQKVRTLQSWNRSPVHPFNTPGLVSKLAHWTMYHLLIAR